MTTTRTWRIVLGLLVCAAAAVPDSHAATQQPVVIDSPSAVTAPIQLAVGRSGVLLFNTPVERASVNDPSVVEVVVVSPTQLLLNGKQPGATSLVIWYAGNNQLLTVMVEPDLEPLRELLRQVLPTEVIDVHHASGRIVLSGRISSQAAKTRALAAAASYSDQVIDLLEVNPDQLQHALAELLPGEPITVHTWENGVVLTGEASSEEARNQAVAAAESTGATVTNLLGVKSQQVVIEVRFAEVNRTLAKSLGFDYIIQDRDVTQGGFVGQGLTPQLPATPNFSRVADGADLALSSSITELFELRRGTDFSLALRALEEKGLVRILAEPNLVAKSGETASFLAGGEFPIPVVQSATGGTINNAVTIEFKKFGVQLNFKPEVLNEEMIRLFVEPEVSVLDFTTAAVTLGGFQVPGLVVRRASTTVQMRSGESLAIGGLLSQLHTRSDNHIPWLGNLPILGKLFSSEQFQREETELLVLVTPRLVKPTTLPRSGPETTPEHLQRVLEQHREAAPYADEQGEAIRRTVDGLHQPAD